MKPTYVSLFAGAGGFDLGFDAAGFRCLAQVEIDRTCRAVLAKHWPDVPRYEDVRAFGAAQVPHADVVVGGFPCQDLSVAGKRAGIGGKRSGLFHEMMRVVDELRPTVLVWENVPGLLSSGRGCDFLVVLGELDRRGFAGGWGSFDARHFGVPQSRERVFGVFARGGVGAELAAEVLALRAGVRRDTAAGGEAGAGAAPATGGGTPAAGWTPRAYGGNDTGGERGGNAALSAKGGTGRLDFDTETFVVFNPQAVRAGNGGVTGGVPFVIQDGSEREKAQNGAGVRHAGPAYTLDTTGLQAVCVTGTVTHTLTAEGHDASEDGTGRGTPIVAIPWAENQRHELRLCDVVPALQAAGGGRPGHAYPAVIDGGVGGYVVRRLMPVECERLMGWPPDHTRYRADGTEIKDGPRYRMCGNGVVATVAYWLARRLRAAAFPEGGAA